MCDTRTREGRAVRQPRWGALYGVAVVYLATLAGVEAVHGTGGTRTALRVVLCLGAFAAITLWLRLNRVAFDLEDWCGCAAATLTIRVIESRPPAADPVDDGISASPVWTDERELVHR
jgi:hypothetical protein